MYISQTTLKPGRTALAQLAAAPGRRADLVLAFGAVPFFAAPDLTAVLQERYPGAVLAGCSTAGEMSGAGVADDTCVITAISFDGGSAAAASTALTDMADSGAAGTRLANALPHAGLVAVLLFGPGVQVNGSALVNAMVAALPPNVPISGGLAGDAGAFRQTWTLGPQGSHARQAVAVGLYGASLTLGYGSATGWEPFGPARKVTRAEGNVLYELDGKRALDLYQLYLGSYASGLPGSGLLFPYEMLGAAHQSSGVLRTILGIDEQAGSLTLAGDIDPDGYLRLMHASTDKLVDGAELAGRQASAGAAGRGATLAILVSCVGRKLVMGERTDEEVEAVTRMLGAHASVAGFYANGEIGGGCGGNAGAVLHNQTMTVTLLGER
jgi:hypothetical protein